MADEACPDQASFLQNMQTGLRWLQETFGKRPRVGWQIDPFGLSAATPSLLAKLGFHGLVINRIGTSTEAELEKTQDLEFVWEGHPLGPDSTETELFTHVLQKSRYGPPFEFIFDPFPGQWSQKVIQCDKNGLERRTVDCLKFLWNNWMQASISTHRDEKIYHVALTIGDDFTFTDPNRSFAWCDTLIEKLNTMSQQAFGKNVKAFYSTVEDYFYAKMAHHNEYKRFRGDFLPYAQRHEF